MDLFKLAKLFHLNYRYPGGQVKESRHHHSNHSSGQQRHRIPHEKVGQLSLPIQLHQGNRLQESLLESGHRARKHL